MKTLRNYLMRQHIAPFLFGIAVFTFIFLASKMVFIFNLVINKGVSPLAMAKLLLYSLFPTLLLTVPMGILLANLIALGSLSSNNEITAIKSSGINPVSVLVPVLISGCLISFALCLSYNNLIPQYNHRLEEQTYLLGQKQPTLQLQENAFNDIGKIQIYVRRIHPKTSLLEDVIISEIDPSSSKFITARTGELIASKESSRLLLKLTDGAIHQPDKEDKNKFQVLCFNVHNINLNLPEISALKRNKKIHEMTTSEIKEKIKTFNAGTETEINPLLVESHKRTSLPFACLSFTLLGIPMGLRVRQKSKSISFGISIAVIFGYWLLLAFAETMGIRGIAPPFLLMWAPNIIFAAFGITLLAKSIK